MKHLLIVDTHTKMIAKICVIFLLIHVTHLFNIDKEQTGFSSEEEKCDDIAIIGAGIAGTYAGWRLRNDNKQITIYEFSNRVGGRMYTVNFPGIPDINLELGAMRFLPGDHKLVNETVSQLGLQIIDFKLGSGPHPDTMMYIRGTHLRYDELTSSKTPFNLNPKELKEPEQLQWEIYRNNTDVLTTNMTNVPENEQMFHIKTLDGIPLYKQSVQSVFHKSISTEAQNFLRETFPFDSSENDQNAALELRTSPPSLEVVKTVASGFNSIPVRLLDIFLAASPRHRLSLNRHLIAIKKRYDGRYALYFEQTITENDRTFILKEKRLVKKCAKRIILAINRLSLERLEWEALHEPLVREYLTQAIKDVHAAKLYLAYDKPWWRQSGVYGRYVISDTLLRQTYDFGSSKFSEISVLQPMYLDEDEVSMWAELVQRTPHSVSDTDFVFTVSNETIKMTHKYLSEIFKINANVIPQPIDSILATWNKYPYGGAWQKWKPGYNVYDVRNKMAKPSEYDDVFVACSGFDVAYGGWSESALRAVELALKHMRSP